MAAQDLAMTLQRVKTVLLRRPKTGIHDDAPATAHWSGGTRVVAAHANGKQVLTDMPDELGGTGDQVSPGWLFRAGLASCAATTIAMNAAGDGIELDALEVRASSRSDLRGLLRMADAEGEPVYAGYADVQLLVRISAAGVSPQHLRTLVAEWLRCSPVPCAVQAGSPMTLLIEVEGA